jgi:hypothetical protein
MKKKLFIIAACVALLLMGSSAYAIRLDLSGNGGSDGSKVIDIDALDWTVSSALIQGGIPLSTGNTFTLFTHAQLGTFQSNSSTVDLTSTGYNLGTNLEVTVVVGFGEKATFVGGIPTPNPGSTAAFAYDSSNTVNFFQIYLDTTPDADSSLTAGPAGAGTGFHDGTMIAEGTVSSAYGTFTVPNVTTTQNLDQTSNGDQLAGQQTVVGNGSTTINAYTTTTSYNKNYFLDMPASFSLLLNDTSNNAVPFRQVDPSDHYWDASTSAYISGLNLNGATGPGDITLGLINGASGPDMLLQTDASTAINAVPEPGSLFLMGLGLIGLAGFGRKRLFTK